MGDPVTNGRRTTGVATVDEATGRTLTKVRDGSLTDLADRIDRARHADPRNVMRTWPARASDRTVPPGVARTARSSVPAAAGRSSSAGHTDDVSSATRSFFEILPTGDRGRAS